MPYTWDSDIGSSEEDDEEEEEGAVGGAPCPRRQKSQRRSVEVRYEHPVKMPEIIGPLPQLTVGEGKTFFSVSIFIDREAREIMHLVASLCPSV